MPGTYFYGGVTNHWRACGEYAVTTYDEYCKIDLNAGAQSQSWGFSISYVDCTASINGNAKTTYDNDFDTASGTTTVVWMAYHSVNVTRTHSAQTVTIYSYIDNHSGYENGNSYAEAKVTVPARASYTISYNANNGTGAPVGTTKWYNEDLTLSTTKPTRSGYTFLGWSTSSTATSATYAAGGKYTANSGATLYAVWKANTYTVSYAANGGTGTTTAQTKTHDVSLTLRSALTRASSSTSYTVTLNANGGSATGDSDNKLTATTTTSYAWAGWKSSADSKTYSAGGSYTLNQATTMTAQWTTSTSGGTVTLPTPTRSGWTFNGWYTASSGGTKAGNAGASYRPASSITLYAQWTQSTWTVSYNANQGSGAPASQTKTQGVTLTLSSTVPTRTGYDFLGWSTSSTATTATYQPGGSYTADAAATLYAVWREKTYTITYNANGGTWAPAATTKRYTQNATITSTNPTWTGHTFLGWNAKSDGSGTKYASGATYATNASVTLYAMWIGLTCSLAANRTSTEDSVTKDDEMGTGGRFTAGWTVDATIPSTSTTVKVQYQAQGASAWTDASTSSSSSARNGTYTATVADGTLSATSTYYVRATVTTTQTYTNGTHTFTRTVTLGKAFALLDAKAGGTGLAIGTVATTDNLLEVAFPSTFRDDVGIVQSNFDMNSTTTENADGDAPVQFRDRAGNVMAYVDAHKNVDGTNYVRLTGKRGDLTGNLYVGSDGTNKKIGTDCEWTSSLYMNSKSKGYYLKDSTGTAYPGVYDNGSNLWLGATETASRHHRGQTYISAGHNGTAGNATIYVSVPNAANNGGTNYGVYHTGNKPSAADVGAVARNTVTNAWVGNSGGTTQHWNVGAKVANANNTTYVNHDTSLIVQDGTVSLYDGTTTTWLWTAYTDKNKPTPAAIGAQPAGTYVTANDSALGAEVRKLASTAAQQWYVKAKVINSSNSINGHETWLVMNNGSCSCWDATASESLWNAYTTANKPTPAAIGALSDVTVSTKTVSLAANKSAVSVTAPTVTGYTFVCWLQPAGSGHTNPAYMESVNSATTNLYSANGTTTAARSYKCAALYKKS